jgi:hypothetical protein
MWVATSVAGHEATGCSQPLDAAGAGSRVLLQTATADRAGTGAQAPGVACSRACMSTASGARPNKMQCIEWLWIGDCGMKLKRGLHKDRQTLVPCSAPDLACALRYAAGPSRGRWELPALRKVARRTCWALVHTARGAALGVDVAPKAARRQPETDEVAGAAGTAAGGAVGLAAPPSALGL